MIRVENIRKRFGVVTALEDVSLPPPTRRSAGVDRRRRASKSTLIKILTGFHKPDSGRMYVHGEEVQLKSVTHARSLGIDTVFQDLALVPGLSVYHNMFLKRGSRRGSARSASSTKARSASGRASTSTTSAYASRRWTPKWHACQAASGRQSRSPARRIPTHDHPARRAPGRDGRTGGRADHRADPRARATRQCLDDRDRAQLRARVRMCDRVDLLRNGRITSTSRPARPRSRS